MTGSLIRNYYAQTRFHLIKPYLGRPPSSAYANDVIASTGGHTTLLLEPLPAFLPNIAEQLPGGLLLRNLLSTAYLARCYRLQ
jgi:hypothetical protein